jgi:alkyldihydroxyacetonephosphate synthase
VDTLETACLWDRVPGLLDALEETLSRGLEQVNEPVHVFSHLSHLYAQGASLYLTYLFRLQGDPERDLAHWRLLKQAASRAIVEHGGTISHQHGVGLDHRDYLAPEKGAQGMALLRAALAAMDPGNMMNPGKLLPREDEP